MVFDVPKSREIFTVNNYEDAYAGTTTLARATTFSDNSVFAQLGIQLGTRKVARLAERMGIRTPVSHNWAMTLGGLEEGVTPLDMAHAYETFASGGELVFGTLSPGATNSRRDAAPGPVGITRINRRDGDDWEPVELPGGEEAINHKRTRRILNEDHAEQVSSLLQGVVKYGTGTRAQVEDELIAGKTGTTENYGDAWFVGWTEKYTIAIWVGYPNELKPMKTEFQGEPVAGGTYPAGIFKTFVESLLELDPSEDEEEEEDGIPDPDAPVAPPAPGTTEEVVPTPAPTDAPAPTTPEEPAPAPEPEAPVEPAPTAAPAPEPTAVPEPTVVPEVPPADGIVPQD
jgi:penicillin-binding protein 1A